MKRFAPSILLLTLCLALTPLASAREYFVSTQGDDQNDGSSMTQAFATIQKGVDALSPGDTLTIGPGEYRENVFRENLGNSDVDTTIRAALRGTVVLRGDVPAPQFTPVKGYRFVHAADFDQPAQVVNEVDTLRILEPASSIDVLEFSAGCFYDTASKKLYIATSDLQPPEQHHYTITLDPEHGLYLRFPTRVIVDGLVATGHNSAVQRPTDNKAPGYRAAWGILLAHANQSVIRHCTAYFNGGGIAFDNTPYGPGGGNLIEYATGFANYTRHSGEGGNILAFSANNDTIAHSYAYISDMQGVRLYGNVTGPAIARHNLAWGNESADIFIKGGQAEKYGLVENSIALGDLHVRVGSSNILSNRFKYATELWPDSIRFSDESRLDLQQEFADPDNLDFRLQPQSRFRANDNQTADRGAFPYKPDIYYVSLQGSDQHDGLSTQEPWRTLDHAFSQLKPGDTLYLLPGVHPVSGSVQVAASEANPVSIRGRGTEPVILQGPLTVAGAEHVTFDRLTFTDPVQIVSAHSIALRNCRFLSEATAIHASNVTGLRITQSLFARFTQAAVSLERSSDVFLRGNIYDNAHGPAVITEDTQAILYANYNSYSDAQQAWKAGGQLRSLPETGQEEASIVLQPQLSDEAHGRAELTNPEAFIGRGPLGRGLGPYHEFRQRQMRLQGPVVHSTTDTTANIEWWSSVPAHFEVAWGDTPECVNQEKITTERYATLSLTDLEPGKTYYFKVVSAKPARYADDIITQDLASSSEPMRFTTQSSPPSPKVYHVAMHGDDDHTGLSRQQAWRNVRHAADRANAGDTILIHEGEYHEAVWVRATGTKANPITFKSAPGEKVIFDGNSRAILTAFELINKHHITIDGIYFIHYGKHRGEDGVISINDSNHVTLSRCFLNGKGAGYPNPFVHSNQADHLLIRNCVVTNAFHGMLLYGKGKVTVEHCIFVQNMIQAVIFTTSQADFHHNIVLDSKASKVKGVLLSGTRSAADIYNFRDNAFYLRVPDEERTPIVFYRDAASYRHGSPDRFSIHGYDQYKNQAGSNLVTNPELVISQGKTIADKQGQPVDYIGDWIYSQPFDFNDLFTTHPQLKQRNIGLVPEDFRDFHFNQSAAAD